MSLHAGTEMRIRSLRLPEARMHKCRDLVCYFRMFTYTNVLTTLVDCNAEASLLFSIFLSSFFLNDYYQGRRKLLSNSSCAKKSIKEATTHDYESYTENTQSSGTTQNLAQRVRNVMPTFTWLWFNQEG